MASESAVKVSPPNLLLPFQSSTPSSYGRYDDAGQRNNPWEEGDTSYLEVFSDETIRDQECSLQTDTKQDVSECILSETLRQ